MKFRERNQYFDSSLFSLFTYLHSQYAKFFITKRDVTPIHKKKYIKITTNTPNLKKMYFVRLYMLVGLMKIILRNYIEKTTYTLSLLFYFKVFNGKTASSSCY